LQALVKAQKQSEGEGGLDVLEDEDNDGVVTLAERFNALAKSQAKIAMPREHKQRYHAAASCYPMLLDWMMDPWDWTGQDPGEIQGGSLAAHVARLCDGNEGTLELELQLMRVEDVEGKDPGNDLAETKSDETEETEGEQQHLKEEWWKSQKNHTQGRLYKLLKINALAKHLHYLCHCSDSERANYRAVSNAMLSESPLDMEHMQEMLQEYETRIISDLGRSMSFMRPKKGPDTPKTVCPLPSTTTNVANSVFDVGFGLTDASSLGDAAGYASTSGGERPGVDAFNEAATTAKL